MILKETMLDNLASLIFKCGYKSLGKDAKHLQRSEFSTAILATFSTWAGCVQDGAWCNNLVAPFGTSPFSKPIASALKKKVEMST